MTSGLPPVPFWFKQIIDVKRQQLRLMIRSWGLTLACFIISTRSNYPKLDLLMTLLWATIAFYDTWVYLKAKKHLIQDIKEVRENDNQD